MIDALNWCSIVYRSIHPRDAIDRANDTRWERLNYSLPYLRLTGFCEGEF